MVRFIDREAETAFLEERYRSGGFELVVLYGRRRVGKTEILKRFVRGKPHLYYLADKRGTARNALRLRKEMAGALGEPEIAATELDELFRWYSGKAGPRPLIVIDEFPYLVEKDDSIPSVFQLLADGVLSERKAMLVLCGSSLGMMEKAALGAKSPLYGRRTGHWKVLALPFWEARRFIPGAPAERCIGFYSVLGGVPHYLEKFSSDRDTIDNIDREVLSRSGRLYEEIDFLLMEELREPDAYKAILEAIASGRGKAIEIAQLSRIPAQDIDKYLKVLTRLGIVGRDRPVTEGPKSKRSRYFIADPLFRLWFTFCEPRKSELELGETASCRELMERQLPAFVGKAFEPLCREHLASRFPGRWPRLGRWWGAKRENGKRVEVEIDIVGLNDRTGESLFGECKWSEGVDGTALLAGLKKKAACVEWRRGARTETFALFARSFKRRPTPAGAILFDLGDIAAGR
ncbi:MAG: ATP-binding protein [Euryarchaeota archaeon]|nr:ATP-binding protein [Euryarchaeota archaeon]